MTLHTILGKERLPFINSKSISEIKAELHLEIPHNLAYFDGHFKDMPVVAGVVQLHWVVHFVKEIFNISAEISQASQIKFMNLMGKGHKPTLYLTIDPEKSLIIYKYSTVNSVYSSGKLSYKDSVLKTHILKEN